MKILVVTQYFWPENFSINDLVSGLIEKGHEITVLTGIPNYPAGNFFPGYGIFRNSRQLYRGAKIIRVPLISRGKGGHLRLAFNGVSFAFFASILAPFVCRDSYDLIFVYEPSPVTVGLPAIVLKKIKSAPIVFWVQDLWPQSVSAAGAGCPRFILSLLKKLVHFIYKACDLILVQSKAFIPCVRDSAVEEKRIVYFPNSVQDFYQPIEPGDNLEERKKLPFGFIIMFAGNIGSSQDFDTVILAAEEIKGNKEIHWVILGDGRMRSWAQEEVRKRNLGGNFHFLGRYPAETMPRYFALADVLLVTLKDEEIFKLTIPSKIQAYLACAKPVIASLNGEGARIIEESRAGFSCPPENPKALAQLALRMYYMKKEERMEMGLSGRKYFEKNFEFNMLIEQLDGVIRNVKGEKA